MKASRVLLLLAAISTTASLSGCTSSTKTDVPESTAVTAAPLTVPPGDDEELVELTKQFFAAFDAAIADPGSEEAMVDVEALVTPAFAFTIAASLDNAAASGTKQVSKDGKDREYEGDFDVVIDRPTATVTFCSVEYQELISSNGTVIQPNESGRRLNYQATFEDGDDGWRAASIEELGPC